MKIGSLFVELGVKGGKGVIGVLSSVRTNLRDAALIANQTVSLFSELYSSVRNLSESSSKYAGNLKIVSNTLGVSTDRLQRWDYAAKLAGAETGEILNTFQSLQKVLLNLRDRGEAPEYFQWLFQNMSKINESFDPERFLNDVDYAMTNLRKLVGSGMIKDISRLNEALSSIGVSPTIANFLRTSRTNLSSISENLLISDSEIRALDQVRRGWVEIDQTVQKTYTNVAKIFDASFLESIKELIVSLGDILKTFISILKEYNVISGLASVIKNTSENLSVLKSGGARDVIKGVGVSLTEDAESSLNPFRYLKTFFENMPTRANVTNNMNFNNADPETVSNAVRDGILKASDLDNAFSQTGASSISP